jgi:hypothetical protein
MRLIGGKDKMNEILTQPEFRIALRLFAFSKASLLYSLEGLTDADLVWQPKPGVCPIGWHAGHVGQIRGAFMWFFDSEPDWDSLGTLLVFGYGSDPDETRVKIPTWKELTHTILEDWRLFRERFETFRLADFAQPVPMNNEAGETLFEMCHRTTWHADHHIEQICALREIIGKPIFPRPPFGTILRKNWQKSSTTGWEEIVAVVDED